MIFPKAILGAAPGAIPEAIPRALPGATLGAPPKALLEAIRPIEAKSWRPLATWLVYIDCQESSYSSID